ncbi:MAG: hypothetical protein JWR51_1052 [Devosia sp.]|uniref:hypothetical protein n=1 Tax=Devosia sp. TaxID=1871048 RepID=UPI00262942CD|nr:hypothetical protein [Devosia sp.]MDB5527949.1 hypothetical protein [Devosia sp.]
MTDEWAPIKTKRFEGESLDAYRRRADKVAEIVQAFRMGRYDREIGEVMERKLTDLLTPALEHSY